MNDQLYCPKCGSSQLTANKKGFGAGKALTGAILTGGVGLLAGFIGSGKVKVTCLKCGTKMNAGSLRITPLPPPLPPKKLTKEELKKQTKDEIKSTLIVSTIIVLLFFIFLVTCA